MCDDFHSREVEGDPLARSRTHHRRPREVARGLLTPYGGYFFRRYRLIPTAARPVPSRSRVEGSEIAEPKLTIEKAGSGPRETHHFSTLCVHLHDHGFKESRRLTRKVSANGHAPDLSIIGCREDGFDLVGLKRDLLSGDLNRLFPGNSRLLDHAWGN